MCWKTGSNVAAPPFFSDDSEDSDYYDSYIEQSSDDEFDIDNSDQSGMLYFPTC